MPSTPPPVRGIPVRHGLDAYHLEQIYDELHVMQLLLKEMSCTSHRQWKRESFQVMVCKFAVAVLMTCVVFLLMQVTHLHASRGKMCGGF